jgi:bacillopeptidase F
MKKLVPLVPLALWASIGLVPDVGADPLALRHRRAAHVESVVLEKLDAGETVPVILVAREAPVIGTHSIDATERRRQVASASVRPLLRVLQAGRGLGIGTMSTPAREVRELWAANAIATRVTAEELEQLKASGALKKVVLDRELNWLPSALTGTAPSAPLAMDAPEVKAENYGLAKVRAPEAWERWSARGEGIRVGHIDTGVDASHPALAGKVIAFKDFIEGKDEAYDDQGHGTHSAGSIVAEGVGVAPGAKLIVAKSLNKFGSGSLSSLMEAMQWMLDPDGDPSTDDQPHLVSNSWGADREALGDSDEVFRDVVVAWREAGIVPVFAAGNAGLGTQSVPGGYPESFAVGATDANDEVASFSTGGPGTWDGVTIVKPDVSAPGVAIISTMPGGGYEPMNGTSMACPHVAGVIALVLQKNPDLPVDGVIQAMQASSIDLGESGRDARYGEGRVDAVRVLELIDAHRNPAPPQPQPQVAWAR